jgi:hypothetical protein
MARELRFRMLLPIAQGAFAALFGGFGLWQRSAILSQPFVGGTLWDTTARYHVWPWPFKFAVVTNMPAFLAGALISWPIGDHWPKLSEFVLCIPSLLFIPILWHGVGSWLDRSVGREHTPATRLKLPWVLLLLFTFVCAMGASIHSTSAYLPYGVGVWMIVGLWVAASATYPKLFSRAT